MNRLLPAASAKVKWFNLATTSISTTNPPQNNVQHGFITSITRSMPSRRENDIIIRSVKSEDFPQIVKMMTSEGRYQFSNHMLRFVTSIDASGFSVAENTITRELLGTVNYMRVNDEYAYGMFNFVKSSHRGLGIAKKMSNHARRCLGERIIIVNSKRDLVESYLACGLMKSKSFIMHNFKGVIQNKQLNILKNALSDTGMKGVEITQIQPETLEGFSQLLHYDTQIQAIERRKVLLALVSNKRATTYLARRGISIVGYIRISPTSIGYTVFPWLAEDKSVAMSLLLSATKCLVNDDNDTFIIVVPEGNTSGQQIAKVMEWQKVNTFRRMYSESTEPFHDLTKIYGVSNGGFY